MAAIPRPLPEPSRTGLGALRIHVEGSWSVKEFSSLLSKIDDSYARIAEVLALGELGHLEHVQVWSAPEPLSKLVSGAKPFVFPLAIDSVRLESPGWIQVIGNLNPIKLITDFVSKWRAENTKRDQIAMAAQAERERTALERDRMLRAFALEVLHQLPEYPRAIHAGRLAEIAEYAITPAASALREMASDTRVGDVQVVDIGTSLPRPPSPPVKAA